MTKRFDSVLLQAASVLLLAGVSTGVLSVARAAEKSRQQPAVVLESGVLKNNAHDFRFQVPAGWRLKPGGADEMVFSTAGCEECALRVLVVPGEVTLEEAVRSLRSQIEAIRGAKVIGEEPVKVARRSGYTILKEEPVAKAGTRGAAGPHSMVRTRFVTFSRGGDQYFLVMRAPAERFADDDAVFDRLLAKFRFGSGLSGMLSR